jgi:hypothetical protein
MLFERFHRTHATPTTTGPTRPAYDPEAIRRRARGTDHPFGGARLGL